MVLIVTEGLKTEPSYLMKLRNEYRLPKSRVRIVSSKRSDPVHLVNEAEAYLKNMNTETHTLFCVFDRDNGKKYKEAIEKFKKLERKKGINCKNFVVISSVPCFEYWYLLHMSASRKPYGLNGSPCASLISDLKKFPIFKDYDKADCEAFYENLIGLRGNAIERAKQILHQAEKEEVVEHYEDPSSRVFIIVELFSKLSHSLTNELHRQ